MADERKPGSVAESIFAIIIFLVRVLPAWLGNIIMSLALKNKTLQIAGINRADALAKSDLKEKDGFAQAGIEIDTIALAEEFSRPNSYLRQQYRRMAQNSWDLKLQAKFARSIVRFMTNYEEINEEKMKKDIKDKNASAITSKEGIRIEINSDGWTVIDRNRMIIMYATRLVENLNPVPIIKDFARPETSHEVLKNKNNPNQKTNTLGNVSILAIMIPQALREKYFKRIIKILRIGAMA